MDIIFDAQGNFHEVYCYVRHFLLCPMACLTMFSQEELMEADLHAIVIHFLFGIVTAISDRSRRDRSDLVNLYLMRTSRYGRFFISLELCFSPSIPQSFIYQTFCGL